MAFHQGVKRHSSADQQQLADDEQLAYYASRCQGARTARLKALLALAIGFVVLYLSGRLTIAQLGYGKPRPPMQLAHAVEHLAPPTPHNDDANGVCTSPACTEFARVINENLAANYSEIDPCADFAEYVCGGFEAKNSPRPDQSAVNAFTQLDDQNKAILRAILESPYPDNSSYTGANDTANRANFAKLQSAYEACMDEDTIEQAGLEPIQNLLNDLPGSSVAYGHTGDLTDALIWLRRHQVSAIVDADTDADDKTPDVVTISVGGGSYGLPSKEYYNRTAVVANYTSTITEMFAIINESNDTAPYQTLAQQIADFEAKIARAQPDPDQEDDVTYNYNPKPFSEVDELVPEISLSRLIKAFLPEGYTPDQVIVRTPDYFPQLSPILKNTSSEILHGYFQWQLISAWAFRLHRSYYRPLTKFNNQLNGRPENATAERWKTCLSEVDSNLAWIESAFWAQTQFGPDDRQFGERIIDDIIAIYTERLDTYTWMAEAVKVKAKQKVANIVKKIGYPSASPNVLDPVDVQTYYANVSVSNDSYFDNGLNFAQFALNITWDALLKPTDKQQWFMSAPTVNAYYNPTSNEIAFPAGIMKNPFFNLELPEYISYGSFGMVAGHELTHGFDNSGSQYDENGAYNQWWDNTTRANFENRTQCFVDQYSKFTVPGPTDGETLHVNGKLTLGENVADAGGVSSSYAAWTKRNAANPDPLLPDLPEEFTPERLFFVSFATTWCQNIRRESAVQRIYTDPHSPNKYRIIGSLANSRPFREAFNCPVKEPTCDLW
ncbi:peptidase family M13 [Macrophomina phaseolina]|uniref:Peptidase family M13 n=1 Tax=Macrophomina phaseolina TaxID=35725 RepID=A0ABQ8FVC8_9PEZI|nr:peptidase family M13 [Macrophomina phaseolina]